MTRTDRFTSSDARSRLDELCEYAPADGAQEDLVLWFVRLVDWLRPRADQRIATKVRFLSEKLDRQEGWRDRVSLALARLLRGVEIDRLLAYGGIPLEFHFGGAITEWLMAEALPAPCGTHDAAQIVRLAFRRTDWTWLRHTGVAALFRELVPQELREALKKALAEALTDLAHQIVAQAHAPRIRRLAQEDRSPYRGLYAAVVALDAADNGNASQALRGRVQQCRLLLRSHRAELVQRGAEINTTFQLRRLREQLDRLLLLAELRQDPSDATLASCGGAIILHVLQSQRGTRLVTQGADLLVQNMVDTAASVGRGYLDDEKSSWRAAFLAGAGGGALMALATIVKYFLARLSLPPFYEGLAFSLNYAGVFCTAYLLHYTIATKLPAHTAAALARGAQGTEGHRERLGRFMSIWRSMLRLQLAGLVGNLVVAGPLAYLLDVGATRAFGHHLLTEEQAAHVLSSNSILGPSVLYAMLTGLFLWISSLVGALADNWVRVVHLEDRLATNRTVLERFGSLRPRAYASALVKRFGGLVGNASLGFMLGAIPSAFAIANLPIEIRHITVSTGAVAMSLSSHAADRSHVTLAALGLVAIAVANVSVSFFLALWLALRATRGMRASPSANALVRIGIRRWAFGKKPRPSIAVTRALAFR